MTDSYSQFLNTYNGRELVKKYSLDTMGTWEILGEDPNCDWGGHHHQPSLGIYTGKLQDIIFAAVELGGFWTWGAGGNIRPVSIKTVNSETNAEYKELKIKQAQLEEELVKIRKEIAKHE